MLDEIMLPPKGFNCRYLKAIGDLADQGLVQNHSIEHLTWGDVDFEEDREGAAQLFFDETAERTLWQWVAGVTRSSRQALVD